MTCAMDWFYPEGRDGAVIFYDVWISRQYFVMILYHSTSTNIYMN